MMSWGGVCLLIWNRFPYSKKNGNYFYNNRRTNNIIKEIIEDWKNNIYNNYPTVLLYMKEYNKCLLFNFLLILINYI